MRDKQALQTVDEMFRDASRQAAEVVDRCRNGSLPAESLLELRMCLAVLPIPTDFYATAQRRIANAKAFFGERELGAAVYELKLLLGGLKSRRKKVWGGTRIFLVM